MKHCYYMVDYFLDLFANKRNEILIDIAHFPEQPRINSTDNETELYSNETACYLCEQKFKK